MTMKCSVCNSCATALIYESASDISLTSLCQFQYGKTKIWQCSACGHLFGRELSDTRGYYSTDYRILLDHEDEDQIYEVQADRIVYRIEHQLDTLLSMVDFKNGARFLDYGCAKGAMSKRLIATRPDLQIHLFDVSESYREYWRSFIGHERCAVDDIPEDWKSSFDIVTSFFAMEHIPDPLATARMIRDLLSDGGCFYGIVPDPLGNYADLVVIDHVNHFTQSSLFCLLRQAGFENIHISRDVHRGALVFKASTTGSTSISPTVELEEARTACAFWMSISNRIWVAEDQYADKAAAIYGSGFYGAYIGSLLRRPGNLRCFLDASPFQQGKQLMARPIFAPSALPQDIEVLYVGLNPAFARNIISQMDWIKARNLVVVYLDEGN